jgi:O-antigen/teichoic acid export membrane protein
MSIASHAASILRRDIVLYALKLITSIIIARKLGPEYFGVYLIIALIPAYAELFGRLKLDAAAVYFLGRGLYSIEQVVRTLNIVALLTSALAVAVIIWKFEFIHEKLFSNVTIPVSEYVYWSLLQIPLQFLSLNYCYLLIYKEDIRGYNTIATLSSAISSVLPILLLTFFNFGIWSIIIPSIISVLAGLIYGVLRLGEVKDVGGFINFTLLADLLKYGLNLYVNSVLGYLQSYGMGLVVALYLAPEQVAFFLLARGLAQILEKVPSALTNILYSRLSKMVNNASLAEVSAKACRVMILILSVLGCISSLAIYPAVYFLYGPSYIEVVPSFLIILLGLVFGGTISSTLYQYYLSSGRANITTFIAIGTIGFQIILAIILIPKFTLIGASIAFALGQIINAFFNIIIFLKLEKYPLIKLMITSNDERKIIKNLIIDNFIKTKNTKSIN